MRATGCSPTLTATASMVNLSPSISPSLFGSVTQTVGGRGTDDGGWEFGEAAALLVGEGQRAG